MSEHPDIAPGMQIFWAGEDWWPPDAVTIALLDVEARRPKTYFTDEQIAEATAGQVRLDRLRMAGIKGGMTLAEVYAKWPGEAAEGSE